MLFFCRCCCCSALVRGSGSVRLLLLPVYRVEPRDLLPVVEALEVVVAEGLALARVVGVADALFFFFLVLEEVEVEEGEKQKERRMDDLSCFSFSFLLSYYYAP